MCVCVCVCVCGHNSHRNKSWTCSVALVSMLSCATGCDQLRSMWVAALGEEKNKRIKDSFVLIMLLVRMVLATDLTMAPALLCSAGVLTSGGHVMVGGVGSLSTCTCSFACSWRRGKGEGRGKKNEKEEQEEISRKSNSKGGVWRGELADSSLGSAGQRHALDRKAPAAPGARAHIWRALPQ